MKQLSSKSCLVSSRASASAQVTPSRWDYSRRRRREGVKGMRCGCFGIESSGGPGNKDEKAHGTPQSGLGLCFALLWDADSSLSEVRNPVFIYKQPSSVFPPQFSPLCIHMHKIIIKLPKPASEGQYLVQTPGCCAGQDALGFSSCSILQQLLCVESGIDAGWEAHDSSQRCSWLALALVMPLPRGVQSRCALRPTCTPEGTWGKRDRGGGSRERFLAAALNIPLPMKYLWWHVA